MPYALHLSLYLIWNVNRAFKLPASRIIHTVGPIYDQDSKPEVLLKNAYEWVLLFEFEMKSYVVCCVKSEIFWTVWANCRNSLKLAKENSIQYIAFPAISCGVFRYVPSVSLHYVAYLLCTQVVFVCLVQISSKVKTWFDLHSYPPKEASEIAISTAKQFSKDIKEVSNNLNV